LRIKLFALCLLPIIPVFPASLYQQEESGSKPLTIDLQDALARARRYGTDVQLAKLSEEIAQEDIKQANAARLPSASGLNQYIYTEGNGTPSGVFVANDGVHVYNEQLIGHEDVLAFLRRGQVHANSPDLAAARAAVSEARNGVTVARYAWLPSFDLQVFYGIDANQFAAVSSEAESTGRSTLPHYEVAGRQNLGYSASATLTIPLWDWGAIHSKVKQASFKEEQAKEQLSLTERQVQATLLSAYREAQTAFSQIESLRSSENLARESLRLTLLRYEAGEATALEVVDAETIASQARAAYDDGLLRYRVALANLGNVTGVFLP